LFTIYSNGAEDETEQAEWWDVLEIGSLQLAATGILEAGQMHWWRVAKR
jgi:hypothetical protein